MDSFPELGRKPKTLPLPTVSLKAKPQPFSLKFCFWENEILKKNCFLDEAIKVK